MRHSVIVLGTKEGYKLPYLGAGKKKNSRPRLTIKYQSIKIGLVPDWRLEINCDFMCFRD